MLQRHHAQETEQRVASLFGAGFAKAVFELPAGGWQGPVLSGYGTHLVFVDELREPPPPVLDEVRERVTQDWVDQKRDEITEQYFSEVLAKYEVVVEEDQGDGAAAADQ